MTGTTTPNQRTSVKAWGESESLRITMYTASLRKISKKIKEASKTEHAGSLALTLRRHLLDVVCAVDLGSSVCRVKGAPGMTETKLKLKTA